MNVNLIAPVGLTSIEAASGNTYTPNQNRVISSVPTGQDLLDLMKAGCQSFDDAEQAVVMPWALNKFYGVNPGDTLAAVLTATALIYAYPIYVPTTITIKTVNINVTTGQTGGAAHVGIYADNLGAPGNLIAGSDQVVTALTSTAVASTTLATPLVLTPGWYWFASAFTASSTFPSVAGVTAALASGTNGILGGDTAAHALAVAASGATSGVSATFTYGALPSTFPSTGYAATVNATTPVFAVGL